MTDNITIDIILDDLDDEALDDRGAPRLTLSVSCARSS